MRALIFFALILPGLSLATSYERGNKVCGHFERAVEYYNRYFNYYWNTDVRAVYAKCLVIRYGGDHEDGAWGISELRKIDQNYLDPQTAYFLADYFSTGGTFNNKLDSRYLKEALDGYSRVLKVINMTGPRYGFRYFSYAERAMDIHLNSLVKVTLAQYMIFLSSATDKSEDGYHLSASPNYDSDLTMENLKKTIEMSGKCAHTVQQDFHNEIKYFQVNSVCKAIHQTSEALLSLERKRVEFIKSCQTYICEHELFLEIERDYLNVISEGESAINRAINSKPEDNLI